MKQKLCVAHFGQVSQAPVDWRTRLANEEDVDDDVLPEKTPADVVGMLGFDPAEFADKE